MNINRMELRRLTIRHSFGSMLTFTLDGVVALRDAILIVDFPKVLTDEYNKRKEEKGNEIKQLRTTIGRFVSDKSNRL